MKFPSLLALLALAGCGNSGGDKKNDGDGMVLNGTNLPGLAQFANACSGTITTDFATDRDTDDDVFVEDRSFVAGGKLLLQSTEKSGKKKDKWSVYWADAGVTGAQEMLVPAAHVTVDCTGHAAALASLRTVALFKDEARTQTACTLESGKIFKGATIGSNGLENNFDGTFDGFFDLRDAGDTGCPADNLYYVTPEITHTVGNTTSSEAFQPVIQILVK